jgi:predicted dehydrogenase
VITTPPAMHYAVAQSAVNHRCAVFTEKPVAHTLSVARELRDLVVGAELPFAMATKFRFAPDVVEAKAMISSGAIGEVRLLESGFSSRLDLRGKWPSDASIAGGGVIVDNGTHALDLALFILGSIDEIRAVEGPRPSGLTVEDTVDLFGRSGPAHIHIDLSWSIESGKPHYLRVVGTEGEVAVGFASSRWRRFGGDWASFGVGYNKFVAMGGALHAFIDAVAHGVGDDRLSDGIRVAEVVDGALTSVADGRSIAP